MNEAQIIELIKILVMVVVGFGFVTIVMSKKKT